MHDLAVGSICMLLGFIGGWLACKRFGAKATAIATDVGSIASTLSGKK